MKKTLVDQLHLVMGPSPTPNYQDESGDRVDKRTTKKLGQLKTLAPSPSNNSNGYHVANLSQLPNSGATSFVAQLFFDIFWFSLYFQLGLIEFYCSILASQQLDRGVSIVHPLTLAQHLDSTRDLPMSSNEFNELVVIVVDHVEVNMIYY
jgi:hypothetical protein